MSKTSARHHRGHPIHLRLHYFQRPGRVDSNVFLVPNQLRILFAQLIREDEQFLCGSLARYSASQPSPHAYASVRAVFQHLAAFYKIWLLQQRQPDVGFSPVEARKGTRQYADHGCRFLVYVNDPSDYGWISAKAPLPKPVAQHDYRCAVCILAVRSEEPAPCSRGCQFREVVPGYESDRRRLQIAFELHGRHAHHRHYATQRLCMLPVEHNGRVRHLGRYVFRRTPLQPHERAWV